MRTFQAQKDQKKQPEKTPTIQAIEKLNAIFANFFKENIISGKTYPLANYPDEPVRFQKHSSEIITTRSWTNGQALAFMFNKIPHTSSYYVNHGKNFIFSISSKDDFKTLLSFSEEKLKASLQSILKKEKVGRPVYRLAHHWAQRPLLKQASFNFINQETNEWLQPSFTIPVNSNLVSDWQTEIIKVAAKYATLSKTDIPTLKFRYNGFTDPNDPGFIANQQMPYINTAMLQAKSCITVRISADKFSQIQSTLKALNVRTPAVTTALKPSVLPPQLLTTKTPVVQPAALPRLFLQSAADRAARIDNSTVEILPATPSSKLKK